MISDSLPCDELGVIGPGADRSRVTKPSARLILRSQRRIKVTGRPIASRCPARRRTWPAGRKAAPGSSRPAGRSSTAAGAGKAGPAPRRLERSGPRTLPCAGFRQATARPARRRQRGRPQPVCCPIVSPQDGPCPFAWPRLLNCAQHGPPLIPLSVRSCSFRRQRRKRAGHETFEASKPP